MISILSCYVMNVFTVFASYLLDFYSGSLLVSSIASFMLNMQNHYVLLRKYYPFQFMAIYLSRRHKNLDCLWTCLLCRRRCCLSGCQSCALSACCQNLRVIFNYVYFFITLIYFITLFSLGEYIAGTFVLVTFAFHFSAFFMPMQGICTCIMLILLLVPLTVMMVGNLIIFIGSCGRRERIDRVERRQEEEEIDM